MGYQALLFCPDEKTARTVTQVLSELEFNVECCIEPFAAVKKLMGQHFDAVVVDCDNEQNATLLFKSARNSTSNQASLAVAVVEGQAGVAKAFRIGANLVLTKPINIEQAKGTLRVARGLLRKSEPGKPVASAMATSPAIPVATKSASPKKTETPAAPAAFSTTSARIKPDTTPAWPAPAAAASSNAAAQDEDLLDIRGEDPIAPASAAASTVSEFNRPVTGAPQAARLQAATVPPAPAAAKTAFNASLPAPGSGAASAPAPAREPQHPRVAAALPESSVEADTRLKAEVQRESSSVVGSAPSFTFGGANVPDESSGPGKTILLGVAAAVIVAAAAYAGWAHFQGRASAPESVRTETTPAPVAIPHTAKPSGAQPSPASAAPKTSTSSPSSQPTALPAKGHASGDTDSAIGDADFSSAPSFTKPSSSPSSAPGKTAEAAKPTAAPLVVKGGKAPTIHAKSGAPDTPAPSMIGIATAGAGAPPPDLGSSEGSAPKPLLQTLNISQGVSRGLLFKKVQPIYPRNALFMRIEGSVELMATISKAGDITHLKVLSGDAQLAKAATDAVKQWKYKPYLLNGEPVEIQTQVTVNFKLPQ